MVEKAALGPRSFCAKGQIAQGKASEPQSTRQNLWARVCWDNSQLIVCELDVSLCQAQGPAAEHKGMQAERPLCGYWGGGGVLPDRRGGTPPRVILPWSCLKTTCISTRSTAAAASPVQQSGFPTHYTFPSSVVIKIQSGEGDALGNLWSDSSADMHSRAQLRLHTLLFWKQLCVDDKWPRWLCGDT